MKKRIGSLLIAFMMVMTMVPSLAFADTAESQDAETGIEINEENFPDEEFRKIITEEFDCGDYQYIESLDDWDYVGANDGYLSDEEIENATYLYIYESYVEDITGIEYFTSLTDLTISDSFISVINKLPESITSLDLSRNSIETLPELPSKLEYLSCSENQLVELPELPSTLKSLYCSDNQLVELPELPSALESLSCGENQLKALPTIPNSLEDLYCSYNDSLTTIPNLPESLKTFYCQHSSLTSIPALPTKLTELYLSDGKLSGVLDISSLHYLKEAYLYGNILTGLKLSPKAKYEYVSIGDNYMSSKSAVTGRDDIDWDNVFYFGYQKTYCEVYGHTLSSTKTSKAYVGQSYAYSGSKYKECTKCGYDTRFDDKDVEIPAVKKIKLSTTSYTYNGKIKKPTVTVYDTNGKKISSSNYKVTYASGRKNVGKYKVTVNFKGNYDGSRYVTFKINPKGTSVSKLTKAKKAFTVKWKKQSGKMAKSRITGYQVRYSTSSKMTSPKTVTIKGYSKTSKKISKLKAKKKYYVQVRTYKTVSGTKYYSSWSKAKAVTTK